MTEDFFFHSKFCSLLLLCESMMLIVAYLWTFLSQIWVSGRPNQTWTSSWIKNKVKLKYQIFSQTMDREDMYLVAAGRCCLWTADTFPLKTKPEGLSWTSLRQKKMRRSAGTSKKVQFPSIVFLVLTLAARGRPNLGVNQMLMWDSSRWRSPLFLFH